MENLKLDRLKILTKSRDSRKESRIINVVYTKWNFEDNGVLKREQTFDYLGIIDKIDDKGEWWAISEKMEC